MSEKGRSRLSADMPLEAARAILRGQASTEFSVKELLIASEIFYRHKCFGEAAFVMEKVVARVPGHAGHFLRLGRCLRLRGSRDRAIAAFQASIACENPSDAVFVELRELLSETGNFEAAARIADDHLKKFGTSDELLLALATLNLRAGRRSEANAIIYQLTEQPPDPPENTLAFAANFFTEMRDFTAAAAIGRKLAARYPGADSAMMSARLLCNNGAHDEAVPILQRLTRDNPGDVDAWSLLSMALAESGNPSEALSSILKALELRPDNGEFCYHAGMLSHRLGHTERALEWLEKAFDLSPATPAVAVAQANILAELGQVRAAIATLDKAQARNGPSRELQSCRLLLLSRVRTDEAILAPANGLIGRLPKAPPRPAYSSTLLSAAAIQGRVIIALVIRDLAHRTAHSRLGLLSALVEPVLQIVMLGVVLTIFNSGQPPLGNSLFFFYATGVMPFYLFLHIVNCTLNVYADNAALLAVPRIQRVDLAIAHALTEISIGSFTAVFIFGLFFLFGYGEGTDNIGAAVAAYAAVSLFAFGVGLIGSVLNNFSKMWEHSWQTVQRVLYFLSGIFFIPQMMPGWAREILVWNPLLVGIEWFRSGFFQQYSPPWIDGGYVVLAAIACIMAGLTLERALWRHMRPAI